MKKIVVLLTMIIFIFPCIVFAGGSNDDSVPIGTMGTKNCYYKRSNERQDIYLKFTLYGLSQAMTHSVSIDSYYYNKYGDTSTKNQRFSVDNFDGLNYIHNYSHHYNTYFDLSTHFSNISYRINNGETNLLDSNNSEVCPKSVYEIAYVNKKNNVDYAYFLCNGYNSSFEVDTCEKAREYLNSIDDYGENPVINSYSYATTDGFNNVGQKDMTQTNINETYQDIVKEKQEVCNKNNPEYDEETCRLYNMQTENLKNQSEDLGSVGILEFSGIHNPTINELGCDSLLGKPTDEYSPAWYLSFAFSVVRYVAIILLIVLTVMDFVEATASQDADILKKSVNKTIKRAILCVIIFLLPTLINFVLQFVHETSIKDCLNLNV